MDNMTISQNKTIGSEYESRPAGGGFETSPTVWTLSHFLPNINIDNRRADFLGSANHCARVSIQQAGIVMADMPLIRFISGVAPCFQYCLVLV
jgi:hypothetical protein